MGATASTLHSQRAEPVEKEICDPVIVDGTKPEPSFVQLLPESAPEDIEPIEVARRARKHDENVQRGIVQNHSSQISASSVLLKEHANEVAMASMASTFLQSRKTKNNPFKYDEFQAMRIAYHRDLIAKQSGKISRSQNHAKIQKEVAADSFLRIHKAFTDTEGWGPGLRLSCQKHDWLITGISKHSGASVSGICLNDKLICVDGHAVFGITFG
jgi:hypothetical protein